MTNTFGTTCDRIPIAPPADDEKRLIASIAETFSQLPERTALRLFRKMAMRWSGYGEFDVIDGGIDGLAYDFAREEGWTGDDLAARYLEGGA